MTCLLYFFLSFFFLLLFFFGRGRVAWQQQSDPAGVFHAPDFKAFKKATPELQPTAQTKEHRAEGREKEKYAGWVQKPSRSSGRRSRRSLMNAAGLGKVEVPRC